MDTLVCAGGSGARVLEAVIHLCAVGLGPRRLRVFSIDGDVSHGNLDRASRLAALYQECAAKYTGSGYFATQLQFASQRLSSWNPMPQETLYDLLKQELQTHGQFRDVLNLLFDEQEQHISLKGGYKAKPPIGAAALALLEDTTQKRQNGAAGDDVNSHDSLIEEFVEQIKGDLTAEERTNVFVVGSVFGGTGASALQPVSRFLKKVLAKEREARIRVGAAALVPYFQFFGEPGPDEVKVDAGNFDLATKTAAEFYAQQCQSGDWHFDSMYWIGSSRPRRVEFGKWGKDQENPAHLVDLLAAFACFDFFTSDGPSGMTYYSGLPGETTKITWEDIPGASANGRAGLSPRDRCLAMFLAGVMHLGWIQQHFAEIHRKPKTVAWYKNLFAKHEALEAPALKEWNQFVTDHENWWVEIQHEAGRDEPLCELLPNGAAVVVDRNENGQRIRAHVVDHDKPHQLFPASHAPADSGTLFHSFQEEMTRASNQRSTELLNVTSPAARYLRLLNLASQATVAARMRRAMAAKA